MRTEHVVSAKTVDEAYRKAQEQYSMLGEVELVEVVNPGKKGFLGIFGVVPAEIRISVDDGKPERTERNPENKPANGGNRNNNRNKPHKNKNNNGNKPENKPQPKPAAPAPEKETACEEIDIVKAKEEKINVTVEEKTIAVNFLKGFIRDIGFECEVVADFTKNEQGFVPRLITIEGKDAPSLIGRRGEMLDSLQYLTNLCLARKSEGDNKEYVKVIIDIENYRERREQDLRALARKMAAKAIKYKRNVPLEPMNPYERMIIHSEVQHIEGVTTHSVGYDENRKIVITYDKKKNK
jgi:spoIIIJ-associated protein